MSTSTNSPESTLEEKQAFYDMLRRHDWFYDYSDDHSVWLKGNRQRDQIRAAIKQHPDLKEIYDRYQDYRNNKTELPARPE